MPASNSCKSFSSISSDSMGKDCFPFELFVISFFNLDFHTRLSTPESLSDRKASGL